MSGRKTRTGKETGLALLRSVPGFKGNLKVNPGSRPGYGFTAGPRTPCQAWRKLAVPRCPRRPPGPTGATPAFSCCPHAWTRDFGCLLTPDHLQKAAGQGLLLAARSSLGCVTLGSLLKLSEPQLPPLICGHCDADLTSRGEDKACPASEPLHWGMALPVSTVAFTFLFRQTPSSSACPLALTHSGRCPLFIDISHLELACNKCSGWTNKEEHFPS